MHCHICDADSDSVKYLGDGEFSPCSVCEQAILECVQGYEDPDYEDLMEEVEEDEHSVGCGSVGGRGLLLDLHEDLSQVEP